MSVLACEFCGAVEGLDKCDWPVMDFVVMRLRDLQVGDLVRRFNQVGERAAVAEVIELQDFEEGYWGNRRVVLRIGNSKRGERCKVFTDSKVAAIRIKRDTRCERVCCARCRVD